MTMKITLSLLMSATFVTEHNAAVYLRCVFGVDWPIVETTLEM